MWPWIAGAVALLVLAVAIRRYSTLDASPPLNRDRESPTVAPVTSTSLSQPTTQPPTFTQQSPFNRPARRPAVRQGGRRWGVLPAVALVIGVAVLRAVGSADTESRFTSDPVIIDIPSFNDQPIQDALDDAGIQFDLQITLANAIVAAEGYWFDQGTYKGLDESALKRNDFKPEAGVTITRIVATKKFYCIEGQTADGTIGSVDKKHVVVRPRRC
ncbi:MAG: hypothetical protein QOG54_2175 [Actinomycetota bacterium]|jgi:hypothetical protein|nr:hypothetical protein [Actinomycetota bacterium]